MSDGAEVQMQPLNSSHVVAAGFDAETGTLVVEFKGGKEYSWAGVSEADYQELLQAPSAGKHMRYVIEQKFGRGLPLA